ncbi:hypothetical protein D3C71_1822240 [compost metagenome]
MSTRQQVTKAISAIDESGGLVEVRQITVFEKGAYLDGGEAAVRGFYTLADGTLVQADLDEKRFHDPQTGAFYKAAE